MLGFHEDALVLSGPAGSGLKTKILGKYYNFWWKITSGGPSKNHANPTAIVDLNAGTGELYLEEIGTTILGSAGHALDLKYRSGLPTGALKIILVEKDRECFSRLQNVVRRRWSEVPIEEATGPIEDNECGVYFLNLELAEALWAVDRIRPGNSVFFFDPLLHIEWETIDRVARERIRYPFQTGTEFILFVFTSDWFTGREYGWREDMVPLPSSTDESRWTEKEALSVRDADSLFGDTMWGAPVLQELPRESRQELFIEEYRKRLLTWWRFVLPMPFVPKEGQLYHLISCSNYEAGIRVTKDFYCDSTGNPRYKPSNPVAFDRFRSTHADKLGGEKAASRPIEWRLLWTIIRQCEGGVCDERCRTISKQGGRREVLDAMNWLAREGYLTTLTGVRSAWDRVPTRYVLDWEVVRTRLGVEPPKSLTPIMPETLMKQGQLSQWPE